MAKHRWRKACRRNIYALIYAPRLGQWVRVFGFRDGFALLDLDDRVLLPEKCTSGSKVKEQYKMGKKLRRKIADLNARMHARERAATNLLVSLECTDAYLRQLTERVEALEVKFSGATDSTAATPDTDDLCARVAASLLRVAEGRAVPELTAADAAVMAEELVRELDLDEGIELTREFSIGDDDGGRVLWLDGEEPVTPKDGEIVEVRWISPWMPVNRPVRERIVLALVDAMQEGDPVIVIGVGETEVRVSWDEALGRAVLND